MNEKIENIQKKNQKSTIKKMNKIEKLNKKIKNMYRKIENMHRKNRKMKQNRNCTQIFFEKA